MHLATIEKVHTFILYKFYKYFSTTWTTLIPILQPCRNTENTYKDCSKYPKITLIILAAKSLELILHM